MNQAHGTASYVWAVRWLTAGQGVSQRWALIALKRCCIASSGPLDASVLHCAAESLGKSRKASLAE